MPRATLSALLLLALIPAPAEAARPDRPARSDKTAWEPGPRVADRYNEGTAQLNGGAPLEAEASFRGVLKREPECGMALLGLGMSLLRQNREAEALAALEQASAIFPEEAELLAALSEAAFVAQDFSRAASAAERAVALEPQYFPAHVTLFNTRVRLGAYDDASDGLDRARIHHGGSSVDCLELELRAEVNELRLIDDLWASCQRSGEPTLIAAAGVSRARAVGDYQAVADAARAAGATELAGMAEVNRRLEAGELDSARVLLNAMIQAAPESPDARLLRANILLVQGDRAGARTDLEAVMSSGAWVDVSASGGLSGVVRYSGELRLFERQVDAGATLARLRAEDGDLAGAEAALADARGRGAPTATLAAAEAAVAFAREDRADGWSALAAGFTSWPDAAALAEVAGEQLLAGVEALPEAVVSALMGSADWTVRYNLAARRFNGGRTEAALSALDGLSHEEGAGAEQIRELRYRAALSTDDLDAADALLDGAPAPAVQPTLQPTLHHVWLRYDAGQSAAALTLLDALGEADAESERAALLRVVLLSEMGRLDEALATVSADSDAGGQALIWVAQGLLAAERNAEAKPVLERACPLLDGEDAVECRGALEQL